MRQRWIVIGVLMLVLMGAAVILLNQGNIPPMVVRAQEPVENPKAEKILEIAVERNIDGEVTSGTVQVRFEDPESLPEVGESAFGVFLGRDGDVISLGTGSIEVEVAVEVVNDDEPIRSVNISHSGDPVDIKVRADTVVYADVTQKPEISDSDLESGSMRVTSEMVPGSLEDIGEGMVLRVWGPVQDGVVSADVLVYELIE